MRWAIIVALLVICAGFVTALSDNASTGVPGDLWTLESGTGTMSYATPPATNDGAAISLTTDGGSPNWVHTTGWTTNLNSSVEFWLYEANADDQNYELLVGFKDSDYTLYEWIGHGIFNQDVGFYVETGAYGNTKLTNTSTGWHLLQMYVDENADIHTYVDGVAKDVVPSTEILSPDVIIYWNSVGGSQEHFIDSVYAHEGVPEYTMPVVTPVPNRVEIVLENQTGCVERGVTNIQFKMVGNYVGDGNGACSLGEYGAWVAVNQVAWDPGNWIGITDICVQNDTWVNVSFNVSNGGEEIYGFFLNVSETIRFLIQMDGGDVNGSYASFDACAELPPEEPVILNAPSNPLGTGGSVGGSGSGEQLLFAQSAIGQDNGSASITSTFSKTLSAIWNWIAFWK